MDNSKKLPISVCILVKNEEDNLINSLPPLSIFKEVVIYDSGSTDNSIELCEKYNANIISGEWLGFSRTRNKLFQQATQPWVFWLDADEVITAELSDEIQKVFSSEIHVNGFEVNRMVYFLGKWIRHGEWFPDWNLRIFRASGWRINNREVHESISIKGNVTRLNSLIEHHSYKSWDDRKSRVEIYSSLWAKMKLKDGRKAIRGEGLLRASWRFLRAYFIKLGCLDGKIGLKLSISIASEVFLKYEKLRHLASR